MRNDRLAVDFGYFLAATAPIATATIVIPLREGLASATLALAFVVVVVSIASFGGRGPATVASLVSVMSFDFFLTRPYLSMRIDSADDIEAAVLLLVVGLIVVRTPRNSARSSPPMICAARSAALPASPTWWRPGSGARRHPGGAARARRTAGPRNSAVRVSAVRLRRHPAHRAQRRGLWSAVTPIRARHVRAPGFGR